MPSGLFFACVHRADAECEAADAHLLVPYALEYRDDTVGFGELQYRFRQVGVCLSVAGNPSADKGQEIEGVEFVAPQQERVVGVGEFQDDHLASRAQHAVHFRQPLL